MRGIPGAAGATRSSRGPLFAVAHRLYHLMVPEGLRLKLWDDRWRRRNITRRVHAPKNHGFRKTLGDVYLFAMVPYYDIGGGQRSAQLAKTLNKMGYSVHYVYAYESSDSGARDPHLPTVRHLPAKEADAAGGRDERAWRADADLYL